MGVAATVIPYEKQADAGPNRDCGAACLSMIYRSLGQKVEQAEIWPAIAKPNQYGSIASTTHLMTKDALNRGFSAVAFQACHPLQTLRQCCESGTRAILNHRSTLDSPSGHYTVLVDVDIRDVVLHDPFYGPFRHVPHDEFLELWQPHFPQSEIAGYVLIAIASEPPVAVPCWLCRTPIPAAMACPRCHQPVSLQPSGALGCIDNSCVARTWNYICCPSCDHLSKFDSAKPEATPVTDKQDGKSAASPSAAKPLDFSAMFAQLDKFCDIVLGMPAAASNPEIKRYMEALTAQKQELKDAQAFAFKNIQAHKQQLAKLVQGVAEKQEAHRKRMEELNRPSPALDAEALGRALLKNLGWDA